MSALKSHQFERDSLRLMGLRLSLWRRNQFAIDEVEFFFAADRKVDMEW